MSLYKERKTAPAGIDRKGYQAADPVAAVTDANSAAAQAARTDKPTRLIETLDFIDGNDLDARDHALYEQLFAYARVHGIDKDEHEISSADMMQFTRLTDIKRVEKSLERIVGTRVSYDFIDEDSGVKRRGLKTPLIVTESVKSLRSGSTSFTYSIPAQIRRYVAKSREWTWLEIGAFPRFKCKYTSPFYQRLAALAGTESLRELTVTTEELAKMVGYKMPSAFNFAVFKRDVISKILADISEHVRRFEVTLDTPKKSGVGRGSGRKISELTFRIHVYAASLPIETKASRVEPTELAYLNQMSGLSESDRPSLLALGKAKAISHIEAVKLVDEWRATLEESRKNPGFDFDGIQGFMILKMIEFDGVDKAFLDFVEIISRKDRLPSEMIASAPVDTFQTPSTKVETSVSTPEEAPAPDPSAGEIIRPKLTVDEKKAKFKEKLVKEAEELLLNISGYRTVDDMRVQGANGLNDRKTLQLYLHEDFPTMHYLQTVLDMSDSDFRRVVVKNLRIVRKMNDADFHRTAKNLFFAMKSFDLSKYLKILKAVGYENEKGNVKTVRTPPKFKSPVRRFGTPKLNEMAAEVDYGDPAYSHAFDDRDASDFESPF